MEPCHPYQDEADLINAFLTGQLHSGEQPQALGTVPSPEHCTAPGLGAAVRPPARDTLPEARSVVTVHCHVTLGRLPKSSFKCSGAQPYSWLRHFRKPNVLIFVHQYSCCDACKCLWKHSVLFSSYLMSLRTAICPLTLSTNFTSFKQRKLHRYKKEEFLFSPLPLGITCS